MNKRNTCLGSVRVRGRGVDVRAQLVTGNAGRLLDPENMIDGDSLPLRDRLRRFKADNAGHLGGATDDGDGPLDYTGALHSG